MNSAFDLRAFRLERHIGQSMLFILGSLGIEPQAFPARGIAEMIMNEVLLHFHLQLVALYTRSDLWLNFLCFQFADFS